MLRWFAELLKVLAMIPIASAFIWIMLDHEERTFGGTIVGKRSADGAVIVIVRDVSFWSDEEATYKEVQVEGTNAAYAQNRTFVFLFLCGLSATVCRALKLK